VEEKAMKQMSRKKRPRKNVHGKNALEMHKKLMKNKSKENTSTKEGKISKL
jgi:hypothetical protein